MSDIESNNIAVAAFSSVGCSKTSASPAYRSAASLSDFCIDARLRPNARRSGP